jgi:Holliday junction resolvasome RuvABC endonuclease subunit
MESFLDDYWKNVRCSLFYQQLKSFSFDVMVVEKQFSVISDVFAVTRLASVHIVDPYIINSSMNSIKSFKSYYPTSWRKILFGSGNIGKSVDAKKFTKEKMNVILNNMGLEHKFNSGDEIDAFALLMTYLKENKLIDEKIFENIKVGDK